jgi:hypothetical protein
LYCPLETLTKDMPPNPKVVGAAVRPEMAMVAVPPLPGARLKEAPVTTMRLVRLKLCVTVGAAAYLLLPFCEAAMVQVPNARKVTELQDTVQTLAVKDA